MSDWLRKAHTLSRRAGLVSRVAQRALRNPGGFFTDLDGYLRRRGDAGAPGSVVPFTGVPSIQPLNVTIAKDRASHLNVLLPGLAMRAMSGGPNTVFNLTYRLAAAGVPVRYIGVDMAGDADQGPLWHHLGKLSDVGRRLNNVELVDAADRGQPITLGANDVFVASAWWTAQLITQLLPQMRSRRFFYMIQEFEPGLYPLSSEHALALETYGFDYDAVVCSSLLRDYLVENRIGRFADAAYAKKALVFEPAIDRARFFSETRGPAGRRRLLFYGRPSAPRNMWELGLAVLKRAVDENLLTAEGWELVSMGEAAPAVDFGRGMVLRPHPWVDYDGYAKLLRSADVGLSLMLSPHTSYPPLEMAACGMPVVSNTYGPKNSDRLARISRNIIATEPTADALLNGLREAVRRVEHEPRQSSPLNVPSSWSDVFAPIVTDLVERWQQLTTTPG